MASKLTEKLAAPGPGLWWWLSQPKDPDAPPGSGIPQSTLVDLVKKPRSDSRPTPTGPPLSELVHIVRHTPSNNPGSKKDSEPVKPTFPTGGTVGRIYNQTEAPKTEAPKTEAPKTEAPKTEAPPNPIGARMLGSLQNTWSSLTSPSKSPAPVDTSEYVPLSQKADDESNRAALSKVLQYGLAFGGAGLAGGALWHLLKNNVFASPEPRETVTAVDLAFPERKKKKKRGKYAMAKVGGDGDPVAPLIDWEKLKSYIPSFELPDMRPEGDLAPTWEQASKWWFLPAATAALGGGYLGGSALANWLSKKREKVDRKGELDQAKEEFDEELQSMYDKAANSKVLDACFDEMEKKALFGLPDARDVLGFGTGSYLTIAGLLAALAAGGMYHHTRGQAPDRNIEKALAIRAQSRALQNPPEIYISPKKLDRDDEEEAEELS